MSTMHYQLLYVLPLGPLPRGISEVRFLLNYFILFVTPESETLRIAAQGKLT